MKQTKPSLVEVGQPRHGQRGPCEVLILLERHDKQLMQVWASMASNQCKKWWSQGNDGLSTWVRWLVEEKSEN